MQDYENSVAVAPPPKAEVRGSNPFGRANYIGQPDRDGWGPVPPDLPPGPLARCDKRGRARCGRARETFEQTCSSPPRSEHYQTELCRSRDGFSPAVRIELGENGGDVKLGSVEGDSQPTCDCFVGGAVCHRRQDFELARC